MVTVAGVVLVRQKPGTAKGVVFITLEDETGTINIVVWAKLLAQYRRVVMSARLMAVRGKVQREGDVIHVVAQELINRTYDLDTVSDDEFEIRFANADHVKSPLPETTSMHRKVNRLKARGETAESDLSPEDQLALNARGHIHGKPSNQKPNNANLIALSRADEVLHPQDDRRGAQAQIPVNLPSKKPVVVNQGKHPRNVRIIPKSRDFH